MPTSGATLFFRKHMIIYLDESGELGWNFTKPYGFGGSSRFLSITFLIIPEEKRHLTKRIVRKVYRCENQRTDIELKGNNLSHRGIQLFSNKVIEILQKHSDIKIIIITVKKKKVANHIRQDPNKLYNYMINLALLDEIVNFPTVTLIPDPRSIKVKSQNSMIDYLQTKLWFDKCSSTKIEQSYQESHNNLNLQFVDFIAYIFWSKYELHKMLGFNILKNYVTHKELYF